jgi:hypothetical protein
MTLPRLFAINHYQQDHPPVHVLLAGFMGVKQKPKESEGEDNLDELLQAMGASGIAEKK